MMIFSGADKLMSNVQPIEKLTTVKFLLMFFKVEWFYNDSSFFFLKIGFFIFENMFATSGN